MTETSAHKHHTIDYIEFAVTDMKVTQQFYSNAFGWTFNDYGPGYAGINGGGKEMGGLNTDSKVQKGGPLVVLYSQDLDSTFAKVIEAGGKIVTETFDFPGGCRFHFADPSGNELAVWALTNS
jgi:predicted enzyme related to lactoylglutathione lyase